MRETATLLFHRVLTGKSVEPKATKFSLHLLLPAKHLVWSGVLVNRCCGIYVRHHTLKAYGLSLRNGGSIFGRRGDSIPYGFFSFELRRAVVQEFGSIFHLQNG